MAVLKTTATLDTKPFVNSLKKIQEAGKKLKIDVKGNVKYDTSKLASQSKKAGVTASKSFAKGFKGVSAKISQTFKGAFGGMVAGGIALSLGRKIIGQFSEFENLAKIQEEAENNLKSALKNTGDASDETFERLKKGASAIQEITTVGDEASLQLMQLGISMGISTDKIDEATRGSIGLSKALKIDMKSAMKMVALAGQGDYTMLQRYIPALRSTKDATEKAAIVQKALANGFKLAIAQSETASGKIDKMKNAFGDFEESIGQVINTIKSYFAPILTFLFKNIEFFIPVIAVLGVAIYSLVGPLIAAQMATIGLNLALLANPFVAIAVGVGALVAGIIYAYKHFKKFRGVIDSVWGAIKILAGYIWTAIKFWAKWMNPIGQSIQLFKLLYNKVEWFRKAIDAVVGAVKKAYEWFASFFKEGKKVEEQTKKQTTATTKLAKETEKTSEKTKDLTTNTNKLSTATKKAVKSLSDLKAEYLKTGSMDLLSKILGKAKFEQDLNDAKAKLDKFIKKMLALDGEISITPIKHDKVKKEIDKTEITAVKGFKSVANNVPVLKQDKINDMLGVNKVIPTSQKLWAGLVETSKKAGITVKSLSNDLQGAVSETMQAAIKGQKSFAGALGKMALTQLEKMLPIWVASIFGVEAGSKGMGALVTVPIVTGLLMGLIEAAKSSFKVGGYTGDKGTNEIAGVVHGQEYVMPAEQTKKYRNVLDNMRAGREISTGTTQTTNRFEFKHSFSKVKIGTRELLWNLNDFQQYELAGF